MASPIILTTNPTVYRTARNQIPFPKVNERNWGSIYNNQVQLADTVIASQTSTNVFTKTNTFQPDANSRALVVTQTYASDAFKVTSGGNVFVIDRYGRIGVGTATPQTRVHITNGNFRLANAAEVQWEDSGGTERTILTLDSSDTLILRNPSGNGNIEYRSGTDPTSAHIFYDDQDHQIMTIQHDGVLSVFEDSSSIKRVIGMYNLDQTDSNGVSFEYIGQSDTSVTKTFLSLVTRFDEHTQGNENASFAINLMADGVLSQVFYVDKDGFTVPTSIAKITAPTGGKLNLNRSAVTIVDGDLLGGVDFTGDDPTIDSIGPKIYGVARGNWGVGANDSALHFYYGSGGSQTIGAVLDYTGYFGIGTTVPSKKLHVVGDVKFEGDFEVTGTTTIINTEQLNTDLVEIEQDDEQEALKVTKVSTGAINMAVFTNAGSGAALVTLGSGSGIPNVGIGTASPSTLLHVYTGNDFLADFQSTNDLAYIRVRDDSTNTYINAKDLRMSLGLNNGLSSNNLNIEGTAGNIGIGTTDPAYKLHVVGTAYVSGGITFGGDLTVTGSAFINGAEISGNTGNTTNLGSTSRRFANLYMASTIDYASRLDFDESGSARVSIESGGNVGIGITNPEANLHLYGSNQTIRLESSNLNFDIKNTGGRLDLIPNSGTEAVVINSSGNVGIGTTSPTEKVEIQAIVNSVIRLRSQSGGNAAQSYVEFGQTETSAWSRTGYVGDGASGAREMQIVSDSSYDIVMYPGSGVVSVSAGNVVLDNNQAYKIKSSTATARTVVKLDATDDLYIGESEVDNIIITAGSSENVRITGAGFVGIGTTNPGTRFEVNAASSNQVAIFRSADDTAYIQIVDEDTTLNVSARDNRGEMYVTGASTTLVVTSNSRVGIGTTNPGYKLHVIGTTYFSGNSTIVGDLGVSGDLSAGGFSVTTLEVSNIRFKDSNGIRIEDTNGNSVVRITEADPYYPNVEVAIDGDLHVDGSVYVDGDQLVGREDDTTNLGSDTRRFANLYMASTIDYASRLDFSYSGSPKISVTTNGRVGIGTTNPSAIFEIVASVNQTALFRSTSDTVYVQISDNDTDTYVIAKDLRMSLGLNNSLHANNLNIEGTSGNIGIGTTNPGYKLHVVGTTYFGGNSLIFGDLGISGDLSVDGGFSVTTLEVSNIKFKDSNGIRIEDTNGNSVVRITEADPYYPNVEVAIDGDLHVDGSVYVDGDQIAVVGNASFNNTLVWVGDDSSAPIGKYLYLTTAGSPIQGIVRTYSDSSKLVLQAGTTSTYRANIELEARSATDEGIKFLTRNVERARIVGSTGLVGIGTTNPGARFEVNAATSNQVAIFRSADDTAYIQIADDDTTVNLTARGNTGEFYVSGAPTTIVVTSLGRVGIGTQNPETNLHLYGTGQTIRLESSNVNFDIKNSGGRLDLIPNSGIEAVSINSSGDVGIGITNPQAKLQVVGDLLVGDEEFYYSTTKAVINGDLYVNDSGIYGSEAGTTDLGSSTRRFGNLYVGDIDVTSTSVVTNLNADRVDSLHASSFVRSDTDDDKTGNLVFTSDFLRMNDDVSIFFGTDADGRIYHSGTDWYFRSYNHGGRILFQGEDTGGTNRGLIYADPDGAVSLCYTGSVKLATTSTGISVTGEASISGDLTVGGTFSVTTFEVSNIRFKDSNGIRIEDTNGNSVIRITEADPYYPNVEVAIDGDLHVDGSVYVDGDQLVGREDDTTNLGSDNRRFANLYMASTIDYASRIDFAESGSTKMSIEPGGYVGIGTTNPVYLLQVRSGQIMLEDGIGTTTRYSSQGTLWSSITTSGLLFNGQSDERPEISFYRGSRTYPEFSIREHETSDKGATFYSGIGTTTPTATMSLSNGRVGIGTTDPSAIFEIATSINQTALFDSTSDTAYVQISDNDTDTYVIAKDLRMSLGLNNSLHANNLNIEGTIGNIGIGTTNPGYKLHVIGTTYFSGNSLIVGDLGVSGDLSAGGFSVTTFEVSNIRFKDSNGIRIEDTNGNSVIRITEADPYYPNVEVAIDGDLHVDGSVYVDGDQLVGREDDTTNLGSTTRRFANLYMASTIDYASRIDFAESGSTKMSIEPGGYVGIGTTNPTLPLDVYNAANELAVFRSTDSKGTISIQDNTTNTYIVAQSLRMSLGLNNSLHANNLNIEGTSGNIGIGTTDPTYIFHLVNSSAQIAIENSTAVTGRMWRLLSRPTGEFGIYDNTASAWRFYIDTSGNVGIGTTNPIATLDINGDLNVSQGATFGGDTTFAYGAVDIGGSLTVDGSITEGGELLDTRYLRRNATDTVSGNTEWQDNYKVMLGTSSDMQIYHDGSENYIDVAQDLNIRHGSELMAEFRDDSGVYLYYDNLLKFNTKSDGVLITGELESSSLDVNGDADISGYLNVSQGATFGGDTTFAYGNVDIGGNLTVDGSITEGGTSLASKYLGISAKAADSNLLDALNSTQFVRSDASDDVSGHTEWQDTYNVRFGNGADMRMHHTSNQNYIDLYNGDLTIRDSGSTVRVLFGKDGNVGIGTTSPIATLDINGDLNVSQGATFGGDTTFAYGAVDIGGNLTVDGNVVTSNVRASGSGGLRLEDDAGNLGVFVEDGGNVGIGTNNPSAGLHITNGYLRVENTDCKIELHDTSGDDHYFQNWNGVFLIGNSTEATTDFSIDQSGRTGIGTVSPDSIARMTILGQGTNSDLIAFMTSGGTTEFHMNLRDSGLNFAETGVADGRLFIKQGGNVGIGTTDPTVELEVNGDLYVNGTLSKNAGYFLIDHPQDPKNKTLRHSFVEAPEMLNVYRGRVKILARTREVVVEMPSYFTDLNIDYEYQITPIGGWAPVYIKEEIKNNKFVIALDQELNGDVEISWQVTGKRNDKFAQMNPMVVEEEKEESKYLNPECFERL